MSKFSKLAKKVHSKALAAYIGDKKYGVAGMERKAEAARRRHMTPNTRGKHHPAHFQR